MKFPLLVLLAAAVAGCAGYKVSTPSLNLSGYPPQFKEGFAEGCQAAKEGSRHRDEARFKSDTQYAAGWRDGYSVCQRP